MPPKRSTEPTMTFAVILQSLQSCEWGGWTLVVNENCNTLSLEKEKKPRRVILRTNGSRNDRYTYNACGEVPKNDRGGQGHNVPYFLREVEKQEDIANAAASQTRPIQG